MKKGFTLIELLIVVAIIAILAAIAVPNFLEAQTRSKVSRVKADMRSLAIAIEMYRTDGNCYPSNEGYIEWSGFPTSPWRNKLGCLTSPVAYFGSIPYDVFGGVYAMLFPGPSSRILSPDNWYYYTDYWPGGAYWAKGYTHGRFYGSPVGGASYWRHPANNMVDGVDAWMMISAGPHRFWYMDTPSGTIDGFSTAYDPTNGTVSFGSIARFGP